MQKSDEDNWTNRLLAEHPALLLSALYLVASLIGLVYSWIFFSFFDINILRYSEIGDFLLASLKEPFTWLLAAFAVTLVLADNANSRRLEKKSPRAWQRWYANVRYRRFNFLAAVVIMIMFLYVFAEQRSREIRSGNHGRMTIRLANDSQAVDRIMLGTTGRFAFFYDDVKQTVYVIPHESILALEKSSPVPAVER